jgi:hypothetical protein
MKDNNFFTTGRNLYFPKQKTETLEEKVEVGEVKTDENLLIEKEKGEKLVSQNNSS